MNINNGVDRESIFRILCFINQIIQVNVTPVYPYTGVILIATYIHTPSENVFAVHLPV